MFFRKKKPEDSGCKHEWVITENLHITHAKDTPVERKESRVSRICKHCLKIEQHKVPGHLGYDVAIRIFS